MRDASTGTAIAGPGGGTAWDHAAGLALAPDGTQFVAERRPGTANGARVVRGTPSGGGFAWDTIAAEGDGPAPVIEPAGLALGADGGTLLVADTGNDGVLRFDAPGHAPAPRATLRVGVSELTRGTIVSDLPGIACPTDCRQSFGSGRTVTLTATPASGSVFSGWTGACAARRVGRPRAPSPAAAPTSTPARRSPPPPPPPVAAPPPAPAPVRIARVRLSTQRLHLARPRDRRRHRPAQPATRARLTVMLSRPATLTVGVQQGRPGRRQGSTCRPVTRRNRRQRPCTRFVALRRTRSVRAPRTTVTFTLTPAFAGPSLPPGSYRLTITALDADGNRAGPVPAAFSITH